VKLLIVVDGKQYEVDVEIPDQEGPAGNYGLSPIAPVAPATLPQAPLTALPGNGASAVSSANGRPTVDEAKVCRSPMAAVVVRVQAEPGQQVAANDLLIVLEAMKMETNVTAPMSGRIKTVHVKASDPVQLNQVLVEFE
jgi:methylmalonyl-CoA carboxyltransferase 1.3S subunit